MKLTELLIIICLSLFNSTFAQLTEDQAREARRFEHRYARSIDRQDTLQKGIILTFSHSTELECIHMTDTSGKIHVIVVRPRNYPGYVDLYRDKDDEVIFEAMGDGSGNPPMYFSISKYDGTREWLPDRKKPE